MISEGEPPLWNPQRGAGQPLLANPNALILHPTTLLFFLLPFEWAFKTSVIAQILLAAAGAWLLLRDARASASAACLGAGVFAFSGYLISLGNLLNLLDSAAFMPLSLWLAGRAVTRGFAPWGSLAALSLSVQVMAGEPAMLLATVAAFLALHWSLGACPSNGLSRAHGACEPQPRSEAEVDPSGRRRRATMDGAATPVRPKGCGGAGSSPSSALLDDVSHRLRRASSDPTPRRSQRDPSHYSDTLLDGTAGPRRPLGTKLAAAAGIALLALAISMVAILPATELLSRSERGAGFDREDALKWSLPPAALIETVVPGLFGDPTRTDPARYWGGGVFDAGLPLILSLYLGPAALILAGTGFGAGVRSGGARRAEALGLGCLAAGGVALALGRFLPLYPALISILPPLRSVRYPVKFFLLATWAVAVLAARGYDRATARSGQAGSAWRGIPVWVACGAAFATLGALLAGGHRAELMASMVRCGLLIALTGLLLSIRAPRTIRLGLLVLPLLDLIAANVSLNPVAPSDFYTTPPRLAAPLGPAGAGRIWAARRPEGFAFRTPRGDEPDSLRWGFFWDRMTLRNATYLPSGYRFAYDRGNERLDVMPGAAFGRLLYEGEGASIPAQESARLLSVAGVDRVITYGGLEGPGLVEAARLEGESRPPVVVMRNENALPRAYVVSRVEVHPDILRAARRLREPSFDPRAAVILEEGLAPRGPAAAEDPSAVPGGARILEEGPTRVIVESSSAEPGYLVLADTFYPGWKGSVDGEERPILRANTMFRAVAVPAGTHRVEFLYKPSSVRSGLMVTAAGLLLAGILAVPRRR